MTVTSLRNAVFRATNALCWKDACFASDAGEIASAADRPTDGEGFYNRAIARAEERGMRPLVAHCHLGLRQLYRRNGAIASRGSVRFFAPWAIEKRPDVSLTGC